MQMCATNSVASVSRLEPEAGRECPWMSIQREEEKAPAWLAQSWQLLSGLGTIKAKSKVHWRQFSTCSLTRSDPVWLSTDLV